MSDYVGKRIYEIWIKHGFNKNPINNQIGFWRDLNQIMRSVYGDDFSLISDKQISKLKKTDIC